jgi:hypothetical protein
MTHVFIITGCLIMLSPVALVAAAAVAYVVVNRVRWTVRRWRTKAYTSFEMDVADTFGTEAADACRRNRLDKNREALGHRMRL